MKIDDHIQIILHLPKIRTILNLTSIYSTNIYALITNYFIFQNTKLNKFTRTILHRMDTTRKEIIDVRKQCDAVNQDASAFRAETSKVRLLNHLIYVYILFHLMKLLSVSNSKSEE